MKFVPKAAGSTEVAQKPPLNQWLELDHYYMIHELLKRGKTYKEIADASGVAPPTIWKNAQDENRDMRARNYRKLRAFYFKEAGV